MIDKFIRLFDPPILLAILLPTAYITTLVKAIFIINFEKIMVLS